MSMGKFYMSLFNNTVIITAIFFRASPEADQSWIVGDVQVKKDHTLSCIGVV